MPSTASWHVSNGTSPLDEAAVRAMLGGLADVRRAWTWQVNPLRRESPRSQRSVRPPNTWTFARHLLLAVHAGTFTAVCDGTMVSVPAGSLVWVLPGTTWTVHYGRPRRLAWLYWTVSGERRELGQRLLVDTRSDLLMRAQALAGELALPGPLGEVPVRLGLAHLLADLWRDAGTIAATDGRRVFTADERERLLLAAQTAEQPADLARALGYGAEHFRRTFRRSFGVPPRRWLRDRRVQQAMALMIEERARPLHDIAAALGYVDQFHFSRQFRAVTGSSPTTWRERGGGSR